MDRVFLDANVLFSAAYKPESRLLQLWRLKEVVLCSSHYAVEEARVNLTAETQKEALQKLSAVLKFFEAADRALPRRISLPEKDSPILLAAIAGSATHLLTGDVRHFGRYLGSKFEGVSIMSPAQYLKVRERQP